jgi:hypothetical protein
MKIERKPTPKRKGPGLHVGYPWFLGMAMAAHKKKQAEEEYARTHHGRKRSRRKLPG